MSVSDTASTTGACAAFAINGRPFDICPNIPPPRLAAPWRGWDARASACPRFEPPIYAAAEQLAQRFYALARSGIDPARLGTGPDGSCAWPAGEDGFTGALYRLCGFLGWIELHRRDVARRGGPARLPALESCLRNIRDALAGGWTAPGGAGDLPEPPAIGPSEMRGIAAFMIPDGAAGVIGYDAFRAALRRDPDGREEARAVLRAARWLAETTRETGAALARARLLVALLIDLMEQLLPARTDRLDLETASRWLREVERGGGLTGKTLEADRVRGRLTSAARI